jgi:SMI1/KNR4 family protein SUKH-1
LLPATSVRVMESPSNWGGPQWTPTTYLRGARGLNAAPNLRLISKTGSAAAGFMWYLHVPGRRQADDSQQSFTEMTRSEWLALIQARGVRPGPAAVPTLPREAERKLGHPLPAALDLLYLAADGLFDDAGQWWVVWPIQRVVDDTLAAWRSGLDDSLLAFGDDGTGNPFCVRMTSDNPAVLRWNWIDLAVESPCGPISDFLGEWAAIPSWPPP